MLFVNKLKTLIFMTCLVLVGQGFAAGEKCAANTTWGAFTTEIASKGTDGYYEIDTPEKLAWFACEVTKGNYSINAKLTQSLDLEHKLFIPIAAGPGNNGAEAFKGTFDGQDFKISRLYINSSEITDTDLGGKINFSQNIGFVAVLGVNGKIKNLTLEDVKIIASASAGAAGLAGNDKPISVGSFVGWQYDGTIENCSVSGLIKTSGSKNRVGGISGNVRNAKITGCFCEATIVASGSESHVGGIAGAIRNNGTVVMSSCVFAGETPVSTGGTVGGIVGSYESAKSVTSTDMYYGTDVVTNGVGMGDAGDVVKTNPVPTVNSEEVVCLLNKGTLNEDGVCSLQSPWSVGETELSLNGSDGYKVNFNANNGTFDENSTTYKFLPVGASITGDGISKPSRKNYVFKGWSLNSGEGNEPGNLGTVSSVTTVYAVWYPIYTITFNVASGTFPDGNDVKTKQVAKGDVITVEGLGELPTFYCEEEGKTEDNCDVGHYFTGWQLSGENVKLEELTATGNLVLNAVWETVKTYTVTYNANEHGVTTVSFVRVGENEKVQQPKDPLADKGYEFKGWYTDATCENAFVFNKEIDHSYVLYAKWDLKSYTITYEMNDVGQKEPDTYTIETPTFDFVTPADVGGYVFEGWFYDAGLTEKATQVIKGTSTDIVLYAKWSTKIYTIEYLADESTFYGVGDVSNQYKEHGDHPVELKSSGYFVIPGYEQDGWATTPNGQKVYDFGYIYNENASLKLYPAKGNIATYTITYKCEACVDNSQNPTTYTKFEANSLKLKTPTLREGYEFKGWYISTDFNVNNNKLTEIKKGSYGNLILYANLNKIYPFVTQSGAVTITEYGNGTAEAVINGNYTGTDAVDISTNVVVNSVTLDRTFKQNVLSSLFLPFSISASQISGATKIYKFNRVAQNDEGIWKVKVSAVTDLTANTPYMVLPSADGKLTFDIDEPVVFNTTTGPETHSVIKDTWEFKGVYAHLDFDENFPDVSRVYGFASVAADGYKAGDFVKVGVGADIPAMRAYLVHHSAPLQKSSAGVHGQSVIPDVIEIEIEDENGIVVQTGKLNTVTGEVRMDRWFDLKGRRLNSKPTVKGTYYKNGKKAIIK